MERTEVWLKWGGTITFPGDVCVSCGAADRVTKSLSKTGRDTGLQQQTTVNMSFPLCEACDLARGDRRRKQEIEASVTILPKTPRYGGKWEMGFSFTNPVYASLFMYLNREVAPTASAGGPAAATGAKPDVPDVKTAPWRHDYPFSGRVSGKALALMVGVGVPLALIIGAVAYAGGATAGSLSSHAVELGGTVAGNLWKPDSAAHQGAVGALVRLALMGGGAILATILGYLVAIVIAVGYPSLMGLIVGRGVAWAAVAGKGQSPAVATRLAVLAGALTYGAFVATTLITQTPLHESSQVLQGLGPPASYAMMAIEAVWVIAAATIYVESAYKRPFCEPCDAWFGRPTSMTMPIAGASSLVEALATGSAVPLEAVPAGVTEGARIKLDLARCGCGRSECELVATVERGGVREPAKGETRVAPLTEPWFTTALPAALGAELERWSLRGAAAGA